MSASHRRGLGLGVSGDLSSSGFVYFALTGRRSRAHGHRGRYTGFNFLHARERGLNVSKIYGFM